MPRIPAAIAALVLLAISDALREIHPREDSPVVIVAIALLTAALPALLVATFLRGPAPRPRQIRRAAWLASAGPLIGFGALVYSGARPLAERSIPPQLAGAATAAVLLPLLAGWVLAHGPRSRFENRRDGLDEPLLRSLAREFRPVGVIFGVSVALAAISDLGWLLPRVREAVLGDPRLSVAGILGMVALVGLGSPRLVRALHPARPLPGGVLRSRLEHLADTAGVALREIYLWETGPRPALNACVCGLLPSSRTVFITDGLIGQLEPTEIEGVFAHELAHGTYHHLWIYTGLVLGLAGVAVGAMSLASSLGIEGGMLPSLLLLPIGALFLLFFGVLSRHLESQADLYSAERTGSPFGIVSALGKIGGLTGTLHRRRGWRHPAIPERIATILECSSNAERRAAFRRRTCRLLGLATAVGIAGVFGWAGEISGSLSAPGWERDLAKASYLVGAHLERTRRPWSDPDVERENLIRAVTLASRSLSAVPVDDPGGSRELAYGVLEVAYRRLGEPWSEAAVRILRGPRNDTRPPR